MKPRIILAAGEVYGRLTVVRQDGRQALCACACGGPQRLFSIYRLRSGHTKSCGCLQRESAAAIGRGNTVHGATNTYLHNTWQGMLDRCYRPNRKDYPRYGGRGIYVCDGWRASFDTFARDVGERPSVHHSLDRIDNNGPYSPTNCRWATASEQGLNTRQTKYVEFNGQRVKVFDLTRRFNLNHDTIMSRLRKGWSVDEALHIPVGGCNARRRETIELRVVGETSK